jgi:CheY-like chemotaxis protein
MANVLKFNLERTGLQVTLARTGTEAIEAAGNQQFDVIITDYQMPGANGEEVCQAVRASTLNRDVPLVLCTAKGYELDSDKLKASYGISMLLSKPFSPMAVTKLVKDLLAGTPA